MPNQTADDLRTRQHTRMFIQYGAARPGNRVLFGGQGSQYIAINGLTAPEIGNVTPIWVPDPSRAKQYKLVGRAVSPADLPKAEVVMREKHAAIPKQLTKIGCQLNLYELSGVCGDLSDFITGWSDYILVYSGGLITDKDFGQRTGFDSDEPIEDRMSLTLNDVYPVGALGFGEQASTFVDLEVSDLVYGNRQSCGNCGEEDDGSKRIYAITKSSGAGSPGISSEVIYSLNGGSTWASTGPITGMGVSEDGLAIDIMGRYLIVIGTDAYYYSELNQNTGVPGTWTKVNTGFVASKSPTDIFVLGPREAYISGNGGYVYKLEDVPSGVSVNNAGTATTYNLLRIHGNEDVLVAVGATGVIIKSINRGLTWATTITSPVALNSITALAVLDGNRYWVGCNLVGRVYYTVNGGETWTEKVFSGAGSGSVWDILFATDEVGYIMHTTTTPAAKLWCTFDGGYSFTNLAPRVNNWPTFSKGSRLAVPMTTSAVAANNVAVAGVSAGGTDGIILVGSAVKL